MYISFLKSIHHTAENLKMFVIFVFTEGVPLGRLGGCKFLTELVLFKSNLKHMFY